MFALQVSRRPTRAAGRERYPVQVPGLRERGAVTRRSPLDDDG